MTDNNKILTDIEFDILLMIFITLFFAYYHSNKQKNI